MRNLTCIVCPIGCSLEVTDDPSRQENENLSVTGSLCPRGTAYAIEEIKAPKRTVTATCQIEGESRRLPVKTSSPCPKEKISCLLEDIYKTKVKIPVKAGDIIISGWNGEKIDIVATRTFL
jgi:CxxC motif-containing protein